MQGQRHRWHSPALGQEMEVELYGHAGRPVLAFPSQDGRVGDFAGFGMIDACRELIDNGRVRLVAVDGIDWQSWTNAAVPPAERARRHLDYDRYVMDELVPFVRKQAGRGTMWVTGCSMGAFHAANFFFRRPDVFDGVIGLSGLYSARSFVADQWDDATYFNSPLQYLPGLADPAYVERYKLAPEEAIQLVRRSGGLAVLAHPYLYSRHGECKKSLDLGQCGKVSSDEIG
jgi:esterase/lipase superfamily enzyme